MRYDFASSFHGDLILDAKGLPRDSPLNLGYLYYATLPAMFWLYGWQAAAKNIFTDVPIPDFAQGEETGYDVLQDRKEILQSAKGLADQLPLSDETFNHKTLELGHLTDGVHRKTYRFGVMDKDLTLRLTYPAEEELLRLSMDDAQSLLRRYLGFIADLPDDTRKEALIVAKDLAAHNPKRTLP